MNRRDAALVVLVLIAALAGFALMLTQTGQGAQVEIAVNGEVYGIYDLDTDQTIEIGEKNICRIENGAAWMEWADCPDQLCVHRQQTNDQDGVEVTGNGKESRASWNVLDRGNPAWVCGVPDPGIFLCARNEAGTGKSGGRPDSVFF